ncbi:glycosyltransferase family 4 protein [Algoriphagus zhangzhouensis]|uniref:Glycosyltransferase involved in cell wall bisynthesis n=1 Tax=Algoriphagus zhangzhouensis TaxID=1073327 RepID=A0A1M7ZKN3_9BACT|nr:glycosyltransferase family 4 protein [Algoriphagus zhangzhouensis]TDY42866.1 glycosyltransferase involved in cell wall biosynthesis [Algoriphagus zhangzhouensis]SHO65379.1 Glycosyltransferase involved in cell wall bisynthesis [Algoriphagus zhangzhouensis]
MKIIQLIQKPQRRGAEIFAAQLSEELRKQGHQVLLVSIFSGEAELPFNGEWIKLNRPVSNRLFDFLGWRKLSHLVDSFKPDIIQANAADTLKFSVISKRLFGWRNPIIYRNANQMGDFIRNRLHLKFNNWLLNQVSGIVSVSEASKLDLHSTFELNRIQSEVIPIGIDMTEIDHAIKEDLKINLPEKFLIQIGGLVPEKDPIGMLDMFANLIQELPDLHLVYIGTGKLKSQLNDEIDRIELWERVQVIAAQENIFPFLSKAKALVLPSKIEGLPGVILEAMYCKIPVVAFGVGGISEVLKEEETGWCKLPDDNYGFKRAIKEILKSENELLNKITDKAFNVVMARYSIGDITNRFEDFYQLVK